MAKTPNPKAIATAVETFFRASPATLSGWWRDGRRAASFFTRFPVALDEAKPTPLARAARAFPLVGAAVGAAAGIGLGLAAWLGLPPLAAAFVGLAIAAVATGALHEDGLADAADGFGAGQSRAQTLKIMRDGRLGAFGILALVFAVGIKAALLASLSGGAAAVSLIAAHGLSRALLPLVMNQMPPARRDGLGHAAGRPELDDALTAALLGTLIALLFLGPVGGLLATGLAAAAALGVAVYARRRIGGHTGDVLGAVQQSAEIAVLAAAAIAA